MICTIPAVSSYFRNTFLALLSTNKAPTFTSFHEVTLTIIVH